MGESLSIVFGLLGFLLLSGLAGRYASQEDYGYAVFFGFVALAALLTTLAQAFLHDLAALQ